MAGTRISEHALGTAFPRPDAMRLLAMEICKVKGVQDQANVHARTEGPHQTSVSTGDNRNVSRDCSGLPKATRMCARERRGLKLLKLTDHFCLLLFFVDVFYDMNSNFLK